jgi:hypothetical protein
VGSLWWDWQPQTIGPVVLENSLSRSVTKLDRAKLWTSFFFAEQPRWPSSIRKQVWLIAILRHVEGLGTVLSARW